MKNEDEVFLIGCYWRVSGEVDGKLCISMLARIWLSVGIYIYIYIYISIYLCICRMFISESTRNILWTRHERK